MFRAIRKFLGLEPRRVVYPFRPLISALKEKDAELYDRLKHHIPSQFRVEWQKVHPEDFPNGGLSAPDASSVVPAKSKGR